MQSTNRPLSPHLAIYRLQITSVLSILHRITGAALFCGLLFLLWWVIYLVYCYNVSGTLPKIFSYPLGKLVLSIMIYCLFHHLFSGIRHLFWDIGKGFELKTVQKSGWLVVIVSFVATLSTWIIALG